MNCVHRWMFVNAVVDTFLYFAEVCLLDLFFKNQNYFGSCTEFIHHETWGAVQRQISHQMYRSILI